MWEEEEVKISILFKEEPTVQSILDYINQDLILGKWERYSQFLELLTFCLYSGGIPKVPDSLLGDILITTVNIDWSFNGSNRNSYCNFHPGAISVSKENVY